jgi:5-methylcytosine-specific restriction enzyme A
MPFASPRPCHEPRCGNLTHRRFCPAHERAARQRTDHDRPAPSLRGYGRTWQRLRLLVLHEEPFCREHLRRHLQMIPATEVDHIHPLADGGGNERANLQALCKPCHSAKTTRDVAARGPAGTVGNPPSLPDCQGERGGKCLERGA